MDELNKYLQSIALDDVTDLNNASGGHSLVNGGGSGKTGGENKGIKDLEAHDRRFHPHGFDPSKDTCSLRENMGVKGGEGKQSSNAVAKVDTGVKGVGEVEPQNIAERRAAVELAKMAKGGNQNAANALKQANEVNKREQFAKEYGEENADYEMEKQRKADEQFKENQRTNEKQNGYVNPYSKPNPFTYSAEKDWKKSAEKALSAASKYDFRKTGRYTPPDNFQTPQETGHMAIGVGKSGKTSAYGEGQGIGLGTKAGSPYDYSESGESGWGKSWKTDPKTGDRVRTDGKFGTLIGPDGRPAGSVRPTFKYDPNESANNDSISRYLKVDPQDIESSDPNKEIDDEATQTARAKYLDDSKAGTSISLPYGGRAVKNQDGTWTVITRRSYQSYNNPVHEYDDGGTTTETKVSRTVRTSADLAKYGNVRIDGKRFDDVVKPVYRKKNLSDKFVQKKYYLPEWYK